MEDISWKCIIRYMINCDTLIVIRKQLRKKEDFLAYQIGISQFSPVPENEI